jgi:hypothetical protein
MAGACVLSIVQLRVVQYTEQCPCRFAATAIIQSSATAMAISPIADPLSAGLRDRKGGVRRYPFKNEALSRD